LRRTKSGPSAVQILRWAIRASNNQPYCPIRRVVVNPSGAARTSGIFFPQRRRARAEAKPAPPQVDAPEQSALSLNPCRRCESGYTRRLMVRSSTTATAQVRRPTDVQPLRRPPVGHRNALRREIIFPPYRPSSSSDDHAFHGHVARVPGFQRRRHGRSRTYGSRRRQPLPTESIAVSSIRAVHFDRRPPECPQTLPRRRDTET